MTYSACLIFSPVAGQGDPVQELVEIREILEPVIELDIRPTSKQVDTAMILVIYELST